MARINCIDVLGLGAVSVDYVGIIDAWPKGGAKKPLQSLTIHDGGLVGTGLVAAARLGGKTEFAGKLGDSTWAKRAVAMLRKEGVGTSFVIKSKDAEPVVAIVITNSSNGERNIFFSRKNVKYPFPTEFPDKNWYQKTKVLFIDFESGLAGIAAAKIARQHGVEVIVDAESDRTHAAEFLAVSSHIVISEDFARSYTGKKNISEMLKILRTSPEQSVIVTRGEKGCVGLTKEDQFKLSAFKVEVVDTTGCGDVFHGAYALAIARKQCVYEAAKFASAAAALCATKVGGRSGIPTAKQLKKFTESYSRF